MIVFQHEDARAAGDGQELGGGRDAVADRWDQRDVGSFRIDQAGGGGARTLVLAIGKAGVECPRSALAQDRGATGFQRLDRQRAVGGRIQVADIAGDIEQVAL